MITYTPLWETMKQRRITIYALIKNDSFSRGTLDSLKHNRNISTATLNDLCNILSYPRSGRSGDVFYRMVHCVSCVSALTSMTLICGAV